MIFLLTFFFDFCVLRHYDIRYEKGYVEQFSPLNHVEDFRVHNGDVILDFVNFEFLKNKNINFESNFGVLNSCML